MPDIFVAEKELKTPAQNKPLETKEVVVNTASETPTANENGKNPLKKSFHLFSAFGVDPTDITFKNQEEGEKILLFLRKSMITNIRWITIAIVLIILPLFVLPIVTLAGHFFFLGVRHIILFTLFYYLLIFSYSFVAYIGWYFNIGIITNIRIVDIDFTNLVNKNIAATKLSLVQDVSFQQFGALRTFFDYGDVFVQTAGNIENFEFKEVPQPENAVHIMEDLIGKYARL